MIFNVIVSETGTYVVDDQRSKSDHRQRTQQGKYAENKSGHITEIAKLKLSFKSKSLSKKNISKRVAQIAKYYLYANW